MNRIIMLLCSSVIYCHSSAQNYIAGIKIPLGVQANLYRTKNKQELYNALKYFYTRKDLRKIQAINFLIANMDIHHSEEYYLVNKQGQKVEYDELTYKTFQESQAALHILDQKYRGLKMIPTVLNDLDIVKANVLIHTIEETYSKQPVFDKLHLSNEQILEYILPYRISVEPLQEWRSIYSERFKWFSAIWKKDGLMNALVQLGGAGGNIVSMTSMTRKEPLPRLGGLQLLLRKSGYCEDMASATAFAFRSQGIPSTVDVIPYWATSTGSHFITPVIGIPGHKLLASDFGNMSSLLDYKTKREPGKVLRITYSKQANSLPRYLPISQIPKSVLRLQNIKDVTDLYWSVQNVPVPVRSSIINGKILFACVLNGLGWKPIWWGRVSNHNVFFSNMSKGVVYLPMSYSQGKLYPEGSPMAIGYAHTQLLKPDIEHTHTVNLTEEDKYLSIKPGVTYKLFFWGDNWIPVGMITPKITDGKKLIFQNVPKNALLLLVRSNTNGKERPFIVTDEGKKVWW